MSASAMEQFVNTVRTLSAQGNFHELGDYLSKQTEMLVRNHSQLGNVFETLDMQQHSLGMLAILTAKLSQNTISDWESLYSHVVLFITECNGEQIRYSPQCFADMCHLFADQLVSRQTPMRGIAPLVRAVAKIQLTDTTLTPVHADVCKLCLLAKCFAPARDCLDTDFVEISAECAKGDPKHLILYFYYGGMIYTALKNFERAVYFFEVAVTIPSIAVSHIMLEAYKKYLLVSLIAYGDRPKEFHVLPKFTSPVVNKFVKPLCSAYQDLFNTFYAHKDLTAVVNKYNDVFSTDENLGLVQQVVEAQVKTNIKRLTKTFVTLSLVDVAERAGLATPAEAERRLVQMIQDGAIHARISQKDGMVQFDNEESVDSVRLLRHLETDIIATMSLDKRITGMEEEILLNPTFIKKSASSSSGGGAAGRSEGLADADDANSTSSAPRSSAAAAGSSVGGGGGAGKLPSYSM